MDGKNKKADEKKPNDEPKGRAKGGFARKEALSPERRTEIARTAARARHGTVLRATNKGNFEKEFGFDADCYVLDDEHKTAVISQRGMGIALGSAQTSGVWIRKFVQGDKIAPFVGLELREKIENPLIFHWSPSVSKLGPPVLVHGYEATILIDICKAIDKANEAGALLKKQEGFAKQAKIIINGSAKAGIQNLVYALSGYDATREEVIAAFKFYVREEAREYEKEFPDQLYTEWYRLYELPKPEKSRPWKFMHLTIEHVYYPLARSQGKILRLAKMKRASSDEHYAKLHQFLSETGVKALRTHLGQLLGMAQVSDTRANYESFVRKVFGVQQEWNF